MSENKLRKQDGKELITIIGSLVQEFLQHVNLEYDCCTRTAKVNYNGPSGWSFSLKTSHNEIVDAVDEADC